MRGIRGILLGATETNVQGTTVEFSNNCKSKSIPRIKETFGGNTVNSNVDELRKLRRVKIVYTNYK